MKKIALTGGGTGGHTFPLVALYTYLKNKKDISFYWFGDEGGLEEEIAGEHQIPFVYIPSGKIRRYFDIRNFYEPFKILSGIIWGIYYIFKYKIDIIFSKGGYVSLPLCIAGIILRKKIYIHESDSISGVANSFIQKYAQCVFYTFPNEKIDGKKHIASGQILNPELLSNLSDPEIFPQEEEQEDDSLEVLIIAGSQGSTRILESVEGFLNNLIDVHFTIILGDKNLHFASKFEKYNNVTTIDFATQQQLGQIYEQTDIAISRGGATTLWELYFFGIHTLIIPLPESAQNHQALNAQYFHDNFGSDILLEEEDLALNIFRHIEKYKTLRKKGLNLKEFFYSLETISDIILK